MSTLDEVVAGVGVLSSMGAAVLWFWASIAPVPDNQNTFILALQKTSQLNAWATTCAAITAICACYAFANSVG